MEILFILPVLGRILLGPNILGHYI